MRGVKEGMLGQASLRGEEDDSNQIENLVERACSHNLFSNIPLPGFLFA
jgi:hypothetical protein